MTPLLSYSFKSSTEGGLKFLSSNVWSYSPYFFTKFFAIKSSSKISSSIFSLISILILSLFSRSNFSSFFIDEKFSIVGFKSLLTFTIGSLCFSFTSSSFSIFKVTELLSSLWNSDVLIFLETRYFLIESYTISGVILILITMNEIKPNINNDNTPISPEYIEINSVISNPIAPANIWFVKKYPKNKENQMVISNPQIHLFKRFLESAPTK